MARKIIIDDGTNYCVTYTDDHTLSTIDPERIFWLRRELISLVSLREQIIFTYFGIIQLFFHLLFSAKSKKQISENDRINNFFDFDVFFQFFILSQLIFFRVIQVAPYMGLNRVYLSASNKV